MKKYHDLLVVAFTLQMVAIAALTILIAWKGF